MAKKTQNGAQNQHYVPKFILRHFTSNPEKEKVSVFSKRTKKGFLTSIRNIMAERRFHEFAIGDDLIASFEEGICRIEDQLLPTYRSVLENRRLDHSVEEKANLSMLIAFQMVRTRSQREQFRHMENQIRERLEREGGSLDQIEGYEPLTEDRLTYQHIDLIKHSTGEFARYIAQKDFVLLQAPIGRSFYLADNPVCLHNSGPRDPFWGNIGLTIQGIEIYMPLSANLMLAAWCPTILQTLRAERERQNLAHKSELIAMLRRGQITADQMAQQLGVLKHLQASIDNLIECFELGKPTLMTTSNMDFNNSLQMNYARDFVICKRGDFNLAKRFVEEFPDHVGKRPTLM